MAKLTTKSYVISSCHQDQRPQHHGFLRSCRNRSSRLSLPARSLRSLKLKSQSLRSFSLASSFSSGSEIHGRRLILQQIQQNKGIAHKGHSSFRSSVTAQMTLGIGKTQKWWEKGLQPNMREVKSAQDLVDSLLQAGDKLVVVDFFSPGCGGCRSLHPKICQLAEMSPDVQFLQVNYEEHKSMCYSLGVHVLPFFRFYRGAQGRVCSFSCTNATIKKFKDALAKHTPDRCSLGPAKGLEEKELLALSGNKDLAFTYPPKQVEPSDVPTKAPAASSNPEPLPLPAISPNPTEEKTLVAAGRG